jgi:hypothetical protein
LCQREERWATSKHDFCPLEVQRNILFSRSLYHKDLAAQNWFVGNCKAGERVKEFSQKICPIPLLVPTFLGTILSPTNMVWPASYRSKRIPTDFIPARWIPIEHTIISFTIHPRIREQPRTFPISSKVDQSFHLTKKNSQELHLHRCCKWYLSRILKY